MSAGMEGKPHFLTQVVLFIASLAFTAWAGVVAYMGESIMTQLADIHDDVTRLHRDLENYKLEDSQKTTRLDEKIKSLEDAKHGHP